MVSEMEPREVRRLPPGHSQEAVLLELMVTNLPSLPLNSKDVFAPLEDFDCYDHNEVLDPVRFYRDRLAGTGRDNCRTRAGSMKLSPEPMTS